MKVVADWYLVREAENNGLVVSVNNIVERKRTELNNELNRYFREKMPKFDCIFSESICEDVLYALNEYIKESGIDKREIDFPYTDGSDIHLLRITNNLHLKIVVTDEYYGGGDYSKFIEISKFVINENTTTDDVDELIQFIVKYLTL